MEEISIFAFVNLGVSRGIERENEVGLDQMRYIMDV